MLLTAGSVGALGGGEKYHYVSGSRWVEARLQALQRARGEVTTGEKSGRQQKGLSAEDSLALLQEAEQWRWGRSRHNRTADPRRAVDLYWTAASGSGPAAAAALFQLGWLHIIPPRLAPPLAIWEPGSVAGGPRSSAVKRHFGDGNEPLVAAGSWEATAVGAGDSEASRHQREGHERNGGAAAGRGQRARASRKPSSGWVVAAARRYLGVDLTKFWMISYLKQWSSGGDSLARRRSDGDSDGHAVDDGGRGGDPDRDVDQGEDLFTLASKAAREYAAASGAHLQLTHSPISNREAGNWRGDSSVPRGSGGAGGAGAANSPPPLVGVPAAISLTTGDPSGRNVSAALELWTHAASLGNHDAQQVISTHFTNAAFLATAADHGSSLVDGGTRDGETSSSEARHDVVSVVHGYFAALGGSLTAQMNMGYRHLYGYGVSQDCDAALPYYELAANQAVEAIRAAAGRYPGQVVLPPSEALKTRLSELTVPRNARRAGKETNTEVVAFYEAAAMAGDSGAAASLGNLLLNGGRGVPQDVRLAAKMYRRAVDPHGRGIVQDDDDADTEGNDGATEGGNGAETLAAIASVEKGGRGGKGRRKKIPAGSKDDGDAGAAGILGVLTYAGVGGLAADEAEAAALWRRGETVGDAIALCGLGILHLTGSTVARPPIEPDIKQAVAYFERSGKKGRYFM